MKAIGLVRWIYLVALLMTTHCLFAQEHTESGEGGEIEVSANALNKEAIFEDNAKYVFEIKNPTANIQDGKIAYTITGQDGEKLKGDSIRVNVAAKSIGKFNFDIKGNVLVFIRLTSWLTLPTMMIPYIKLLEYSPIN
jgi:hypothetical protein